MAKLELFEVEYEINFAELGSESGVYRKSDSRNFVVPPLQYDTIELDGLPLMTITLALLAFKWYVGASSTECIR